MKKVLLTGATGFIGRHVIPFLLAKGYQVHAVSSVKINEDSANIHWHCVDLLSFEQTTSLMEIIKPSYLLHLAWYAEPGKYWSSLENFRWVQASIALLQEFHRQGGERIVMAGTCSEYDWDYGYCSEMTTPISSTALYGTCKNALQSMLSVFSKETGLSSAWGRTFFLYGPHEHPDRLVSSVIRSLIRGKPALCTDGTQLRDFLYVQDVAMAFVALMESDIEGAVNIASGQPIALRNIIYNIADKLDSHDLVRLGALQAKPDEPRVLFADVEKLFKQVKWKPKFDLDKGLELTIKWWKDQTF